LFRSRSILSVRNEKVTSINKEIISRMPGDIKQYFSADRLEDDPD